MGNKSSRRRSSAKAKEKPEPASKGAARDKASAPTGGGEGGNNGGRQGAHGSRGEDRTRKVSITGLLNDIDKDYDVGKTLGSGHYGKVHSAVDRHNGARIVAIKSIKKRKVRRLHILKREIDIMKELKHPNIIELYDVYEDEEDLHLVMEQCTGGELFDRIVKRGHYSEKDAATLVRQLLSSLEYCHAHLVVHRDLKPENFLFATEADDSPLKLIDFGLSRKCEGENDFLSTRVGTPYYIAPEVLSRHYDKACDLWSTGVITYILLCGYPPFWGDNDRQIFARIKVGSFDYPREEWDCVSSSAKDLISQLLRLDPTKRPTATEALKHPWIAAAKSAGDVPPSSEPAGKLADTVLRSLRRFTAHSRLKRAALGVIASKMSEVEISGLKNQFEAIDADHDGTLTVNELGTALDGSAVGSEVASLVMEADADGDGKIDYNEFVAASLRKRQYMKEELVQAAFDHFDSDGTGHISADNLRKALRASNGGQLEDEGVIAEILNSADASRVDYVNKDGQIDFSEFKRVMDAGADSADAAAMSSSGSAVPEAASSLPPEAP